MRVRWRAHHLISSLSGGHGAKSAFAHPTIYDLKLQRLGLLDLRQCLHLRKHLGRHRAIDLDQRDGVAALLVAAEVEGRDVDLRIASQC
jgi:hypothetical protein